MIDRETVDRIYAAANIVDIIGEYVTLKRKGVNYVACCPFHNEKTPSFVVSPSKGLYKCFGCGKGGNAVTFVMDQEATTYAEALKMVAKRYGIEVKEEALTEEEVRRNDDRESMFALNSWAADYFANYLHHETEGMSVGMAYFRQKRGMTDATIKKFGLGFCPAKGDRMSKDALAAGYKAEFLVSTGLSLSARATVRSTTVSGTGSSSPCTIFRAVSSLSAAVRCVPTRRSPSTRTPPKARFTAKSGSFTGFISPRRRSSSSTSPLWSKDIPT